MAKKITVTVEIEYTSGADQAEAEFMCKCVRDAIEGLANDAPAVSSGDATLTVTDTVTDV